MKRLSMAMLVLFAAPSCSVLNAAARGDVGGALNASRDVAHDNAGKVLAASAKRDELDKKYCIPLQKTPVGWDEEKAVGGAIILGDLENVGYFIDHDDIHDARTLMKKVAAREPVTLAPSDKNDLTTYVARVGANLAGFSPRPGIPWVFGVVESKDPAAFSAPAGYIVVTTGLMKLTQNEAQLASVLAHEITHVTLQHSLKRYQAQRYEFCHGLVTLKAGADSGVGASELGSTTVAAGADVIDDYFQNVKNNGMNVDGFGAKTAVQMIDFVRKVTGTRLDDEDEFAADLGGVELLAAAGYDTSEMGVFLKKMPDGGSFMGKHPATAKRVERLDAWRAKNAFSTGSVKPTLDPIVAKVIK